MADYTPVYSDENAITLTASAAITGGQMLVSTGAGTVGPSAGTAARGIGVAEHDAPSGGRVTMYLLPGVVHEVTNVNAGTIAAGSPVIAGAAGGVDTGVLGTVAAAGTLIGIALTTAVTTAKLRFIGV